MADTLRSFVLLAGDVLSPGGCATSSSSVRYWHRSDRYVMLSCWRSNNSSTAL